MVRVGLLIKSLSVRFGGFTEDVGNRKQRHTELLDMCLELKACDENSSLL